jgi:GAF domain-containing protein
VKPADTQRPFVEKVTTETREYLKTLLTENHRLECALAEAHSDRDCAVNALEHVSAELRDRKQIEVTLRSRVAEIEKESEDFFSRYAEVEQQNSNLANLYVASYQLHGTRDRRRVLTAIKEVIINLIGSEELGIWEVDESGNVLALVESFGIEAGRWMHLPINASCCFIARTALTGERFVVGESNDAAETENVSACVPLKLDDKVIGIIGVFRLLPQKNGFEPLDLELFDLLATHAATALYCTRDAADVEAR